ncbi:MAG: asparagine synthase-related protein, partial [Planctomycetaceae bacterium]
MTPIGFSLQIVDAHGSFQKWGVDDPRRALLLSHHHADDVELMLLGRIHYRDEWRRRLAPTTPQELSDAELAHRVYRQLGARAFADLEGDFAMLCWDRSQQRAFARRDVLGGYPLFWRVQGDLCSISTSLEPIVSGLSSRQLNLEYVADFLMLPAAAMDEVVSTHCVWNGIERLLPGALLSVDLRQGIARVEKANLAPFCNGSSHAPSMTFDEATDRFRETLTAAVKTRVSGKMAAHVSGGFDSTSVAILAAEQQPSSRLVGLSLVFNQLHGMSIERPYVDAAYAGLQTCDRHDIEADGLLDFDSFATASSSDEPCPYLSRLSMESPMLQVAGAAGANTLLTQLRQLVLVSRILAMGCESANCRWHYIAHPYGMVLSIGFRP